MSRWIRLTFVSSVLVAMVLQVLAPGPETSYCRDRLGYFTQEHFEISTCSLCYFYLILNDPQLKLSTTLQVRHFHTEPYYLIKASVNGSMNRNVDIYPSPDNQTAMAAVCATLDDADCTRWTSCCESARDCCDSQVTRKVPSDVQKYCPQTFDGWSCWDFTQANTTADSECPVFLASTNKENRAYKQCLSDGSWAVSNGTGLEYTDYDDCNKIKNLQILKTALILGIVLNSVAIILIIPALIIFASYRHLRRQQRIKIHINLFLSLLLSGVFSLAWDVKVRLDRQTSTEIVSTLHSNQNLCKSLNMLHRLARAITFFWMSCEGFYLHRLMVKAFHPHKRFHGYLLYGWGAPTFLFSLYGVLRKKLADDRLCWITPLVGSLRAMEWLLIFVPTILCILINIVFLFGILRIILKKRTTLPNEPSTFRKAFRATLILIPLFGVHQFCLIYRPKSEELPGYNVYEIASAIILNSQGIIISLVFCYFNGEVQSSLKGSWVFLKHRQSQRRGSDGRKLSFSTSRRTSMASFYNGGLTTDCTVNTTTDNNTALTDEMNGDIKLNTLISNNGRQDMNGKVNHQTIDLVKCSPNVFTEKKITTTQNGVKSTNFSHNCVLLNGIRNGNNEKHSYDNPDVMNTEETESDMSKTQTHHDVNKNEDIAIEPNER